MGTTRRDQRNSGAQRNISKDFFSVGDQELGANRRRFLHGAFNESCELPHIYIGKSRKNCAPGAAHAIRPGTRGKDAARASLPAEPLATELVAADTETRPTRANARRLHAPLPNDRKTQLAVAIAQRKSVTLWARDNQVPRSTA